jgi:hypothetical protein
MPDLKRLIAEVAARNGIRIEPDDPLFAIVTLNQLVLEETAQRLLERVEATVAGFETSIQQTENRAGRVLAQRLKESLAEARRALQHQAGSAWVRAHTRIELVCWAALGVGCVLAVFYCGVWAGMTAFR